MIEAVEEAEQARRQRNEVVHQDWVLRGAAATRPVAEIAQVPTEDLQTYIEEWDREAVDAPGWLRLPARELALVPPRTLDDLRQVERRLAAVADRAQSLVFAVASSRNTGKPAGYVRT